MLEITCLVNAPELIRRERQVRGEETMMNLAAALQRNAASKPDKTALICGAEKINYAQFDAIAGKIAACLLYTSPSPRDY